jgi:drug/metabolite transporter (DMT)-like permease
LVVIKIDVKKFLKLTPFLQPVTLIAGWACRIRKNACRPCTNIKLNSHRHERELFCDGVCIYKMTGNALENGEDLSRSPSHVSETKPNVFKQVWLTNKGVFLILLAQATGSTMDAIVRFLQQGGHGMHPFQVIFARMSITALLSTLYMWYTNVPDFPLGAPAVRGWLILRALAGFFGLFCLYCKKYHVSPKSLFKILMYVILDSVHYLPLAEATVFRFLVPIITAWACSIFLGQIFSRTEFLAGVIALLGVVIIAHPAAIFGRVDDDIELPHQPNKIDEVSAGQRLLAIFVSVIGVLGASAAYTLIRVIGSRAHALISVNYFALISTFGSAGALLVLPDMSFVMPHGAREWLLLSLLGVLGFVLQFLLTAGLQLDRTSKATSMLYTGILFALAFDWAIWGVFPGFWSCIGGAVVIASTLWSALQKSKSVSQGAVSKQEVVDEESALLGTQTGGSEDAARAGVTRESV